MELDVKSYETGIPIPGTTNGLRKRCTCATSDWINLERPYKGNVKRGYRACGVTGYRGEDTNNPITNVLMKRTAKIELFTFLTL